MLLKSGNYIAKYGETKVGFFTHELTFFKELYGALTYTFIKRFILNKHTFTIHFDSK